LDFTDKVILITGGSRGIGRAAAQMFAEHGGRVVVNYQRNQEAAEQTLASLPGGPHLVVQADVADPDAVQHMVETTVRELGGLDVLVNNAAIYEYHQIATVSYETWQLEWARTLATNLTGAANLTYCAAQHMMKQGSGRIINVSSRGAFRGEPSAPAYGASKAGLNALSQSMAKALGPHGISVYAVAPGWVDTDMATEYLTGPRGEEIRAQSPLGRVATAEEVAYTILFLASEGAAYLTGAIVDVNGASYLRT
jgi:3-oxoacyl-[acyl-carrier protein] reductase